MKKKISKVHLTYEGRLFIENSLNEGKSITAISNILGRDRSNIGKEILKHRFSVFPSSFNNSHPCLKQNICTVKSYECYLHCKNIEINLCPKLISSPQVCNGCTSKHGCRHVKFYYKALEANNEYLNSWHNDRTGLHYNADELNILNTDFFYLFLKNKSIYHSLNIINSRGYDFKIGTIYKQIERNQLKLKSSDLPRRRKKDKKEIVDNSYKRNLESHTYENFLIYVENHSNAIEMQMDTVEGIKENNAPVILTLQIVKIHFSFIFKINNQNVDNVIDALSTFENIITKDVFARITEILLTDNGK